MDYTENTDNTPLNHRGEPIPEGNIVIPAEVSDELREMVEDVVEDVCRRAGKEGLLLSGETAWKVVSAVALAKEAQFAGLCT